MSLTPLERQLMSLVTTLVDQLKKIDISLDRMQYQLMEVTSAVDNLNLTVTRQEKNIIGAVNETGMQLCGVIQLAVEPKTKEPTKATSSPEERAQQAIAKLNQLGQSAFKPDPPKVKEPTKVTALFDVSDTVPEPRKGPYK